MNIDKLISLLFSRMCNEAIQSVESSVITTLFLEKSLTLKSCMCVSNLRGTVLKTLLINKKFERLFIFQNRTFQYKLTGKIRHLSS